ncbi:unnamed protein product [Durusdinium trenchii]|uniref:Uncharacterized protein n=1 Tax=Durusdinium trenchii TaxID=1381693 RepID=A0ABP0RMG4_9DINO
MASKKEICPLVWYRRARLLLGLAAVVLTGLDNYLWCWNQAPRWLLGTLVLLTGWGWGDAVLRFPLIHDIDSFFTIKQVVLTGLKVIWVVTVFSYKKRAPFAFCITAMSSVMLPMAYAMSLPLDEMQEVYKKLTNQHVDKDLCVRIWYYVADPEVCWEACEDSYKSIKRTRNHLFKRGALVANLGPGPPSRGRQENQCPSLESRHSRSMPWKYYTFMDLLAYP